jgi:nucleotide-binding universal stress UspA family protein
MYRSLLVPLDGSPFGEQALPLALSLARRAGAALHLVHVIPPVPALYAEALLATPGLEDIRPRQQTYLDDLANRLRSLAPVAVHTAVLDGGPGPTLQDHAGVVEPDLVVLTTHGRGPLRRFWLGSVADYLVRHLDVPVLLLRPHEASINWTTDPAPRHILLPLDGSALAEEMIEPVVALASLCGADFLLLRAIRPVMPVPLGREEGGMGPTVERLIEQIRSIHEQLHKEAESYLEGVAQRLRSRGLQVKTRVAVEEQPALAILHEANPPAIDLVALQTHGRGSLARLLLGSVADKVIRGAAVPVLVRRPTRA